MRKNPANSPSPSGMPLRSTQLLQQSLTPNRSPDALTWLRPICFCQGPSLPGPSRPSAGLAMHAQHLDVRPRAQLAHESFIPNLVIKHGPAELLGRLVLAADTAACRRGVFLSFAAL